MPTSRRTSSASQQRSSASDLRSPSGRAAGESRLRGPPPTAFQYNQSVVPSAGPSRRSSVSGSVGPSRRPSVASQQTVIDPPPPYATRVPAPSNPTASSASRRSSTTRPGASRPPSRSATVSQEPQMALVPRRQSIVQTSGRVLPTRRPSTSQASGGAVPPVNVWNRTDITISITNGYTMGNNPNPPSRIGESSHHRSQRPSTFAADRRLREDILDAEQEFYNDLREIRLERERQNARIRELELAADADNRIQTIRSAAEDEDPDRIMLVGRNSNRRSNRR